jgi:hypothetical protein
VPLLQITKGALVDNLEIVDQQNNSVLRLPSDETRDLIAWALDCIVRFASAESMERSFDKETEKALAELISLVCQSHAHPNPDLHAGGVLSDPLEKNLIRCLGKFRFRESLPEHVENLCLGLAQSELYVVEVTRPESVQQFQLTYRQVLPHDRGRKLSRFLLSLAANSIDGLPMVYADRAQDYDFQVTPIQGQLVSST